MSRNPTDPKEVNFKRTDFGGQRVDETFKTHFLTRINEDDAWIEITAHRNFIDLDEIKKIDARVKDVGEQRLLTDNITAEAIVVVPKDCSEEIMTKLKSNFNVISAEKKTPVGYKTHNVNYPVASALFPVRGGAQPESATALQMRDGQRIERTQCTQEEWKEWMRKFIAENNFSSVQRNNR